MSWATEAGRYRMRTPMALRLLGTEEEIVEALYSAPERLSMPLVSDAGLLPAPSTGYRYAFPTD